MATISYTFNGHRCGGGGHTFLNVSINGGTSREVMFITDEVRAPLSELSVDDVDKIITLILRAHLAGKTRAQIVSEFQAGPVTVTI